MLSIGFAVVWLLAVPCYDIKLSCGPNGWLSARSYKLYYPQDPIGLACRAAGQARLHEAIGIGIVGVLVALALGLPSSRK